MAARARPRAVPLAAGTHVWAGEVPWLPDLLASPRTSSLTGHTLLEAFGRQVALLRAVATTAPEGSALQLRFSADPEAEGSPVRLTLLGRGGTESEANLLARLVLAVLPQEMPFDPVPAEQVEASVRFLDDVGPHQWAEVRRAVETLQPRLDGESGLDRSDLAQPVVLPWNWSPQALLSSLGLLREQSAKVVLGVHLERRTVPVEVLDYLQEQVVAFRRLAAEEENPLVAAGVQAYRRWLRELPRAALHLRTFLASEEPIAAGVAEAVGVDLTRGFEGQGAVTGGFWVARPRTVQEADVASELLQDLTAGPWQDPADPDLAVLLHLFDPHEANTAFRFPVTVEGGLAGVATGRLSSLPAGAQQRPPAPDSVLLGPDASGELVGLSRSELNRHVLVAGLPGFGKTTTVQSVLLQLHEQGVPFLVIDPAKSDYAALPLRELRRVVLDPEEVGFNPLAVPEGSTSRRHGARVLAAFDAAFGFSVRWPLGQTLLSRALFAAYEAVHPHQPTLNTLYAATADLVRREAFAGPDASNVRASLLGRLEGLAEGPLGSTLLGGSRSGPDWAALTSGPTVVELRAFTAPAERSLVFALLLAGLISHREAVPVGPGLGHVVVLEEAHRVLGARPGQPVPEGTRAFVEALAELRGSGQGFVVVEQAPSLLDPAVLKNTATKLVHRTVDLEERQVLGRGILLRDAQLDDLARLPSGRAIVYSADSEAPRLAQVDPRSDTGARPAARPAATLSPVSGPEPLVCSGCPVACHGRAGAALAPALLALDLHGPALAQEAFARAGGRAAAALCAGWWVTGLRLPRQRSARDAARNELRREVQRLTGET